MIPIKERVLRLLRGSETYTKTDMVYLTTGSFWLGFGQVIASLSSFILAVLFANLVPQDTYGTYKYILSVMGMLAIFTLVGVNAPLAQSIARGREGTFRTALRAKMRWGTLGLIASLGLGTYYTVMGNEVLAGAFFLSSIFIPFMDPLGLYNTYLQSKRRFKEAIIFYTISQLIASAIIAATIFFTHELYFILLAYLVSWTGLRLLFHYITYTRFPPNTEVDSGVISRGKHLSFIGALSTIVSNIDSFLIFHFLGAAPVALYTFATAPIDQLRSLFKNISPLALPKLANRSIKEINRLLVARMAILFSLGIAIAVTYVVAAPYLFAAIFPRYLSALDVSAAFAFTLALHLPLAFFAAVMQSKIDLMPKAWFYWGNLPQLVLIGTAVVLVPHIGLWGIVASVYLQALTALVINVLQWRILSKRHD